MDIVVPWKFPEEWSAVGELIYSDDRKKIKKAYEVLRSWKSRCQKLPAGAECTIIILEALLVEDETKDIPEFESQNILASCYAMALTRFLNLASSFEKERTYLSLYRIARHLNLPEWIVNLRHQSSHGLELPSLVVLKAGLKLALDWLDNEYWKSGISWKNMELSSGLMEKFSSRLISLVVSYQDLMKLKISTHENRREEYRLYLNSIMIPYLSPSEDDWLSECGLNEEIVEDVPNTVNECLMIITGKLRTLLKTAEKRSLDVESLLKLFLLDSLFLPAEDKLNLYSDDLARNVLPKEMIVVWGRFLEEVIHMSGLLPTFIQKLIDFKSRQEMPQRWASVWVKYLASYLKNAQVTRSSLVKKRKKSVKQPSRESDAFNKRKEGKQSKWTIVFDADFLPEKSEMNSLIEDVISNPRRSTLVYIRELLALYEEPLSDQKTDMIVKAIEIQLQTLEDSAMMELPVSHVGAEEIEEFCENVLSQVSGEREDSGSGSSDFVSAWEDLPLGIYPGYYERLEAQGPILEFNDDVVYLSE